MLDQADALRAKRRAALAQLDTLTQSIFLDMFGDPATNPNGHAFHSAMRSGFKKDPDGNWHRLASTGVKLLNVGIIEKDGHLNLVDR